MKLSQRLVNDDLVPHLDIIEVFSVCPVCQEDTSVDGECLNCGAYLGQLAKAVEN